MPPGLGSVGPFLAGYFGDQFSFPTAAAAAVSAGVCKEKVVPKSERPIFPRLVAVAVGQVTRWVPWWIGSNQVKRVPGGFGQCESCEK